MPKKSKILPILLIISFLFPGYTFAKNTPLINITSPSSKSVLLEDSTTTISVKIDQGLIADLKNGQYQARIDVRPDEVYSQVLPVTETLPYKIKGSNAIELKWHIPRNMLHYSSNLSQKFKFQLDLFTSAKKNGPSVVFATTSTPITIHRTTYRLGEEEKQINIGRRDDSYKLSGPAYLTKGSVLDLWGRWLIRLDKVKNKKAYFTGLFDDKKTTSFVAELGKETTFSIPGTDNGKIWIVSGKITYKKVLSSLINEFYITRDSDAPTQDTSKAKTTNHSQPSCTISTSKKIYSIKEPIVLNWSTKNTSKASWGGYAGSSMVVYPPNEPTLNGSQTFVLNSRPGENYKPGEKAIALEILGEANIGHDFCEVNFTVVP